MGDANGDEDWEKFTTDDGKPYYYSRSRARSSWTEPQVRVALETASGDETSGQEWTEHTTDDGKSYFYNTRTKTSVWDIPAEVQALREREAASKMTVTVTAEDDSDFPAHPTTAPPELPGHGAERPKHASVLSDVPETAPVATTSLDRSVTPPGESPRMLVMRRESRANSDPNAAAGHLYMWGQLDPSILTGDEAFDSANRAIPCVVRELLHKAVVQAGCGLAHSLAVTDTGELYSWGKNGKVLGRGDEAKEPEDRLSPTLVKRLDEKAVVGIACGQNFSIVSTESGELWSWGDGAFGQLGHGNEESLWFPQILNRTGPLVGYTVASVSCGAHHVLLSTEDQVVFAWGRNHDGQLGIGDTQTRPSPTIITDLSGVTIGRVSGGASHSAAMSEDGRLWMWGNNDEGQTGFKDSYGRYDVAPRHLADVSDVCDVACGGFHTLCMVKGGAVFAWGRSMHGQLGVGPGLDNHIQAVALARKRVIQLAAGCNHSAALTDEGELFLWGAGIDGQLGTGGWTNQRLPTLVEMHGKRIVHVALGDAASMALCGAYESKRGARWIPDADAKRCMECERKFTSVRRRHHCRICGGVFCNKCSNYRRPIPGEKSARVCEKCYKEKGGKR